jgi:PAS domain S-box-containing protein
MIDERGIVQAFNEPACQLWGFTGTEVMGRNVKMLMPAPDRDMHDGYIKRYLETGKHKVLGMGRDVIALHKVRRSFASRG